MKELAIVVVAACEAAPSHRSDPPPPPPPAPTPVVTCLDTAQHQSDAAVELQRAGGVFHVCYVSSKSDDQQVRTCIGLDARTGKAVAVPPAMSSAPYQAMLHGTYEIQSGVPHACADGTCIPLGPKAAKAMLALEPKTIEVTQDRAVVMGDYEAWNVAQDRRLVFEAPPNIEHIQVDIVPVGRNVMVSWVPCAGPCTRKRVFTSEGTLAGIEFETEHGPLRLDAARFALASPTHVAIYDHESGVQLRTIEWAGTQGYTIDGVTDRWNYAANDGPLTLVPLGQGRAVITAAADPVLTVIDYATGTIEKRLRIPLCNDLQTR